MNTAPPTRGNGAEGLHTGRGGDRAAAPTSRPGPSFWTMERDDRLRHLWTEGVPTRAIARALGRGCNKNKVIGRAHRIGLDSHPNKSRVINPRDWKDEDKLLLVDLRGNGLTFPQMEVFFPSRSAAAIGSKYRQIMDERTIREEPPAGRAPSGLPRRSDGPGTCCMTGCRAPRQPGRDLCATHHTELFVKDNARAHHATGLVTNVSSLGDI